MWQNTPYNTPLAVSAMIVACTAVYVWRHRGQPGASPLYQLLSGVAIWSFASALEIASASPASKMFWNGVLYLVMLQDISERKKLEAEEAADQKFRQRIWAMDTAEDIDTVFQVGCESLQMLGFPFALLISLTTSRGSIIFLHILSLQRDRLCPPRRAMTSRSCLGSGGHRLRSIAQICMFWFRTWY